MHVRGKEPNDTAVLNKDEQKKVGAVIAKRIAKDVTGDPDYSRFGRDIGTLLWLWKEYGPAGEMTGFLTGRFTQHPEESVRFLEAFIGRAWGLESGLSHKSDFDLRAPLGN